MAIFPSHRDKNSGEDGFPFIDSTARDAVMAARGERFDLRPNELQLTRTRPAPSERGDAARVEGLVSPLTVDDRVANDFLGQGDRQICWARSVETLMARKDEIAGLAVASDERIEANLLYVKDGNGGDGDRIASLLRRGSWSPAEAAARSTPNATHETFRFSKVHPAEISKQRLEMLGFSSAGRHLLSATRARSE